MSETAATENDWVCDLATRPTDLFTFGTVGLIVGTIISPECMPWSRPGYSLENFFPPRYGHF